MRSLLWLLPLVLVACSRAVVDESFYAPTEVELAVALSEGGDAWVLPAEVGEIDGWRWSWQERDPLLVDPRPSAPDGAATQPRAHYATEPLDPALPRITIGEVAVDRGYSGKWRARLRISYRDPRAGVTWSQRLRLDEDDDGSWKVDLGPNPLTGLPHHATITVREAGAGTPGSN
ncbi:MAG: hypothetical protein ISR76_05170 [Planctomycetes bacterium]|nr:hypothetical protein [Planctomycetota bacterium]MBL7008368.1 hypothetical protein [Planctomycetota bacterium]